MRNFAIGRCRISGAPVMTLAIARILTVEVPTALARCSGQLLSETPTGADASGPASPPR